MFGTHNDYIEDCADLQIFAFDRSLQPNKSANQDECEALLQDILPKLHSFIGQKQEATLRHIRVSQVRATSLGSSGDAEEMKRMKTLLRIASSIVVVSVPQHAQSNVDTDLQDFIVNHLSHQLWLCVETAKSDQTVAEAMSSKHIERQIKHRQVKKVFADEQARLRRKSDEVPKNKHQTVLIDNGNGSAEASEQLYQKGLEVVKELVLGGEFEVKEGEVVKQVDRISTSLLNGLHHQVYDLTLHWQLKASKQDLPLVQKHLQNRLDQEKDQRENDLQAQAFRQVFQYVD